MYYNITTYTLKAEDETYYVAITGLKLINYSVNELLDEIMSIEKKNQVHIIVLRARYIFSTLPLITSIRHALLSFKRGRNIARKFPIEVMLYLSGRRQIHEAIALFAPKESDKDVVLCVLSRSPSKARTILTTLIGKYGRVFNIAEDLHSRLDDILNAYGISKKELENTRVSVCEDVYTLLLKCVLTRIAIRSIMK
ncbi:MAG: hypothetical protein DRZ82_05180 [Thermoprotei archaeon]|nr:MAG: hypothetical protein DRZ82_05180 [Thermoprotei archaeon]